VGIEGSFPREIALGREADHSVPSNAEVDAWSYNFVPPINFLAWFRVKYKDNFALSFQSKQQSLRHRKET
jgi:hypothetical protein